MRSPRLLTFLLVVLVVVPAGILGWLGIQGTDRFESELRRRLVQELHSFAYAAESEVLSYGRYEAHDADARVAAAAELLARRLPFEPAGRALNLAKESMRTRAPDGTGAGIETDSLWQPLAVDLRILDAMSRTVLPVPFEPDGTVNGRTDPDRLFDDLARDADAEAFGRGSVAGAVEVWKAASARFTEPAWRARAEIEAALVTTALRPVPLEPDVFVTALEERFSASVLLRVGRPWVLLLLRVSPWSAVAAERLRVLHGDGFLVEVPLTDQERARIRELVSTPEPSSDDSEGGGHDVHRAALPGGFVLEVTRRWRTLASGPAETLYRTWGGMVAKSANLEFRSTPPAIDFSTSARPLVEVLQLPNPGGMTGWLVLRHRDEARLLAEVERSRRWTIVGVLSLVGVIGLGLLVGRRALAREREARRLKDDFLANVSHELRTPLTSVCLHADLLAEAGVPDAQRLAHAEVVRAEGARLSALVDDLLDFAALERGSRRLEPEPVDIGAAAERALAPFRVLAAREGATLTLDVAPGELLALADPHALGRILSNLVGNAWKHGRPSRSGGPGRLTLRVSCADDRPTVDVMDDGPGVPPNERARLFERFQRGVAAGRTRGVGLGLALSRDLAQALGGDLVYVEDPARTVFRLTLPPVPPSFPPLSDAPPARSA